MRLILAFVFFIIPNILWAEDLSILSYFDKFYMAFSIDKLSERDYNLLISMEDSPFTMVNYDVNPPEPMPDYPTYKDMLTLENSVLFNGSTGKMYFLDFLKSAGLVSDSKSHIRIVRYKSNKNEYTYTLKVNSSEKIVINFNVIASIPDTDFVSETSCDYFFIKDDSQLLKLRKINCAG
ncbi:TPA: hypothetical protein N3A33_004387 [Salmonella enterica subsp. salamae serovar 28:r:e,n,z15]|nr:hypothetical protein [Salmonella enterica subsp. salamae serovar 28:r:e,n,z15]